MTATTTKDETIEFVDANKAQCPQMGLRVFSSDQNANCRVAVVPLHADILNSMVYLHNHLDEFRWQSEDLRMLQFDAQKSVRLYGPSLWEYIRLFGVWGQKWYGEFISQSWSLMPRQFSYNPDRWPHMTEVIGRMEVQLQHDQRPLFGFTFHHHELMIFHKTKPLPLNSYLEAEEKAVDSPRFAEEEVDIAEVRKRLKQRGRKIRVPSRGNPKAR